MVVKEVESIPPPHMECLSSASTAVHGGLRRFTDLGCDDSPHGEVMGPNGDGDAAANTVYSLNVSPSLTTKNSSDLYVRGGGGMWLVIVSNRVTGEIVGNMIKSV